MMMTTCKLHALPSELTWHAPPQRWKVEQEHTLTITAGEMTDVFTDPRGHFSIKNAPRALFTPLSGNFVFSAKVRVDFQATFDAGVLLLYEHDETWAKLCFEFSPQQQPMVVSVVNRGVSDDCNSASIEGNQVYLRIARIAPTFAFHYSIDRQFWHLVRYFSLGELQNLRVGFSTQSPTGHGCTAIFSDISYDARTLSDIRSGG
jgi:regulation of enolase protein 1 (concanavalin A-like superfamily)